MLRDPVGLSRVPDERLILLQHAGGAAVRDAEQEAVFGVLFVVLVKRVAGHSLEAAQREIRVRIYQRGQFDFDFECSNLKSHNFFVISLHLKLFIDYGFSLLGVE